MQVQPGPPTSNPGIAGGWRQGVVFGLELLPTPNLVPMFPRDTTVCYVRCVHGQKKGTTSLTAGWQCRGTRHRCRHVEDELTPGPSRPAEVASDPALSCAVIVRIWRSVE